ncbi:putative Xaa-Pro aminopeptidase [Arthroderma uncinatum]|uniref:putative Xaa-Pro aminopeptidase n=1 Tax=Arthroderma uncinatum TaxID=74035 RepID=UPI00144AF53C|nr:putative Xaa-Pro aminopeptidase [Arthroderma uncinatum]KAF3481263.1 putative Xaa-Pro aminopeptidase [Arthroderma uncinatum]
MASYSIAVSVEGTSIDKYPAKQHARRVAARLSSRDALIYLPGQQTVLSEDSDQATHFKQRRYFFYLTGVVEPDCHVTYDVAADRLTLYVPDFDFKRTIWTGPTLGVDEARQRYDVDRVEYFSSLEGDVQRWTADNPSSLVYILHPDQRPVTPLTVAYRYDQKSLQHAMDACRVIKDEHEIGLIQRANDVSAAAHRAVLSRLRHMKNEAEIAGIFIDVCLSMGSRGTAYETIAASGANGATLHYTHNNEPLAGRQMVVLDAGSEWHCYASDVTRSFPIPSLSHHILGDDSSSSSKSPWPSREAEQIYSIVQRMQEECISQVKEGALFFSIHQHAHSIALHELLKLGILRIPHGATKSDLVKAEVTALFFPHGLGHHLGLEVHDVSPDSGTIPLTSQCLDGLMSVTEHRPPCTLSAPPLASGMVITVEPGIYFNKLAIEQAKADRHKPGAKGRFVDFDVAERYLDVGGVRIEDDVLVTRDGSRNLTTAPKGREMLSIIYS